MLGRERWGRKTSAPATLLNGAGPSKEGGWSILFEQVVSRGACSGCGACVIVCPHNVLSYDNSSERPETPSAMPFSTEFCPISISMLECDFCRSVCHRIDGAQPRGLSDVGLSLFGRSRREGEELGIYKKMFVARSLGNEVLRVLEDECEGRRFPSAFAQDGGVVTSLAVWALSRGLVDGVVLARRSEVRPWDATPRVAVTVEEVMACAGVHGYTYSPNLLAVKKAVEQGVRKLAFIGLPCQVQSLRMIQHLVAHQKLDRAYDDHAREIASAVRLVIGLFCSESFTYEGLINGAVARRVGDLSRVAKINIKEKVRVFLNNGEVVEISLKEAKRYARPTCTICNDFAAEYADISVGGLGLKGWNLVLARTTLGEKVFSQCCAEGFLETRPEDDNAVQLSSNIALRMVRRKRTVTASANKPQP